MEAPLGGLFFPLILRAVDRHHKQRVAWCPGLSRSRSVATAHVQTTREQLQQRLKIIRLTPMKCPQIFLYRFSVFLMVFHIF